MIYEIFVTVEKPEVPASRRAPTEGIFKEGPLQPGCALEGSPDLLQRSLISLQG